MYLLYSDLREVIAKSHTSVGKNNNWNLVRYMNPMFLNEELESHANKNKSRKIIAMSLVREE